LSILQSGGIDSSLISLAVGRRGAKTPLFTASFHERTHDEVDLARQVAAAASLPHRVVPAESAADLCDTFRSVVYHFDGQCADTGALGFYSLSRAVREHSTVVLSGDGGDEFFCGYETYAATRIAEIFRHLVPPVSARWMGRLAYRMDAVNEGRLPMTMVAGRFALGLGEGGSRPHLEWRRLLPAFLADVVYGPGMKGLAKISPYRAYAAYYDGVGTNDVLDRAMLADQRFHLQSVLTKVDAMSMAHSLEVRVPLLDRRVMELAGRLSLRLLNPRCGPPKRLLRVLAQRLGAPPSVTKARKKGFNVPIARLLRHELRPIGDLVLDRNADILSPYLKPDVVRGMWRAHRDRQANHAFALWPMLTLAAWLGDLARPQPTSELLAKAEA
jgi:asparagine synthase (glutamine-hydrolysing)